MITVPVVHGNFVPLPLAEPLFRMRHGVEPKALGRMNIEVKLALPDSRRWVVEPSQFIENIDDDFIYVRADPKLTGEACSLGVHWVVGEPWGEVQIADDVSGAAEIVIEAARKLCEQVIENRIRPDEIQMAKAYNGCFAALAAYDAKGKT